MTKRIFFKILSFFYLLVAVLAGFQLVRAPFLSLNKRTARAESPATGSYACILYEETYFCSSPDPNEGLFLLPTTYYVKLLNYQTDYCRVEYLYDGDQVKKLIGYVETSLLTFVEYVPKRPYYYQLFELSYRIDDSAQGSDFLGEITLTCAYYGDYKVGAKNYCYVLRGDSFGYVPKPTALTVRENTEYAEYLASQVPSAPEEGANEKKSNASPAQIAILVALCLLVPLLAALILKPPRRPPYETDG